MQSPDQTTNLILNHLKNNYNLNIVYLTEDIDLIPTILASYSNEIGFDCGTQSLFIKKNSQINISLITFHAAKAINYNNNDDAVIDDATNHLKWELDLVNDIGLLAEWISEFRTT